MYPSSDHGFETATQPPVLVSPESKREQRVQKTIKYFSSKIFLIQLVLTIVFAVIEIIFGQTYNGQCPAAPQIPLFLLVHGSTKLGWAVCGFIPFIGAKYFSNSAHIRIFMLINVVIQLLFMLFWFAWFIAGNVWVWSVRGYMQTTDSTVSSTYCQSTLYSAAQGLIISTYIVFGIITCLIVKRRLCNKTPPPVQQK